METETDKIHCVTIITMTVGKTAGTTGVMGKDMVTEGSNMQLSLAFLERRRGIRDICFLPLLRVAGVELSIRFDRSDPKEPYDNLMVLIPERLYSRSHDTVYILKAS